MTTKPSLSISQIEDQYVRKNFEALDQYFKEQNQFLDFKFFEQVFTAAQTGQKLSHGLGYVPLDIVVTHITGTGKVTFQYGQFDTENIVLDATGPCRVRFYVGTSNRSESSVQNATADAQAVTSGVP